MTRGALDLAVQQWQAGDPDGALRALLDAWRAARDPRIAALIDRVSDHLLAKTGPITAKTVKMRTELWMERAARVDPVDLGALLATPWPGTWKPALPVLRCLLAFPHDPRIAMALARVVEQAPFDTYTSSNFYGPALTRLEALRDTRTIPLLTAALAHTHGYYWDKSTRPQVTRVRDGLAEVQIPALAEEVEAALARALALFATEAHADAAREKGEADLLAAIHADPDDDAPRMVYADWLAERGDPRGEFIALQLARHQGRGTAEGRKRERALLRKHGAEWLGPVAHVLDEDRLGFERGFLAHAVLDFGRGCERMPGEMSDPALATVHTVEVTWSVTYPKLALGVACLPNLARVRCLLGFPEGVIHELSLGPPRPQLTEIEVCIERAEPIGAPQRERIVAGDAFPNVVRLGIHGTLEEAEPYLRGALARRLERITLHDGALPLGPWLRLLARLGLSPAEIAVGSHWLLVMRRDREGRPTVLSAGPLRDEVSPTAGGLAGALDSLDVTDLTAISVDRSHTYDFSEAEIRTLEESFARFPGVDIDVPWERIGQRTKRGPALMINISPTFSSAQLPAVWALVGEPPLSLTFDAMSVNHGGHTNLPADGLARATSVLAKKRTRALELYRKGSGDTCKLAIMSWASQITCELAGPDFVDRYLAWLERLAGAIPIVFATVAFTTPPKGVIEPFRVPVAWLKVLGADHEAVIPFDAMIELATRFPWMRARRVGPCLALVLGESPSAPPEPAQLEALSLAAVEAMWRAHGFRPHELVLEILAPALEAAGFAQQAAGKLVFTRREGKQQISLFVERPPQRTFTVILTDELRGRRKELRAVDDGPLCIGATVDETRSVLAALATRVPTEILGWFA